MSLRVTVGSASLIALVMALAPVCSDKGSVKAADRYTGPACGDKTFTVNLNDRHGVTPGAQYVCPGDKVRWIGTDANGTRHTFEVNFDNDESPQSPFHDHQTHFNNGSAQSDVSDDFPVVTVFKFTIIIDNDKKFDPHLVGGGGNRPPPKKKQGGKQ